MSKEMLKCCRDCSYQCKQYDDLTDFCGCGVANMEMFGMTEPSTEDEEDKYNGKSR